MDRAQLFRDRIALIEAQLTQENKANMGKINGYMMIAAAFHREEEAVTEALLAIYQDVLDAQSDGLSAEGYLGKNSKQIADDLLSDLPPLKWYYGLRLTGVIALLYLGWQFMVEFGTTGQMSYHPLGLFCDVLLAVLLPTITFFLLKVLIYMNSKVKAGLIMIGFGLVTFSLALTRFWVLHSQSTSVVPIWGTSLILLGLAGAIVYYRKNQLVLYSFLPAYVLLFISGGFALYLQATEVPQGHWLWWGHFAMSIICPLLAFISVPLSLLRKKP